jgi:hypothetical protein
MTDPSLKALQVQDDERGRESERKNNDQYLVEYHITEPGQTPHAASSAVQGSVFLLL